jgi:hypothetical protein
LRIPESYKTLIGLILLGFIVMVYSYYSNKPIIRDNLTEISGQLQNNPRLITWGGDMPEYEIELNLTNYEKKEFSLVDCGYQLTEEKYILGLPKGTMIKLFADRHEFTTDNDVEIYCLYVNGKMVFSLNDYNKCSFNYWKRVLPMVLIILILLIFRVSYGLVQSKKVKGGD